MSAANAGAPGTEFDTLEAASLPRKQAEALAEVHRQSRAGLATRADLDDLERRLTAYIETRIERAEKRGLMALITVAAVVIAAVKYL